MTGQHRAGLSSRLTRTGREDRRARKDEAAYRAEARQARDAYGTETAPQLRAWLDTMNTAWRAYQAATSGPGAARTGAADQAQARFQAVLDQADQDYLEATAAAADRLAARLAVIPPSLRRWGS